MTCKQCKKKIAKGGESYIEQICQECFKEYYKKHFMPITPYAENPEVIFTKLGLSDPINHPSHYQGKVECIDAIEAA